MRLHTIATCTVGLLALAAIGGFVLRPAVAQDGTSQLPAVQSAGPFHIGADGAETGLLLPAVQKVRQFVRVGFYDREGNLLAVDPVLLLPAVRGVHWELRREPLFGDGVPRPSFRVMIARRGAAGNPLFDGPVAGGDEITILVSSPRGPGGQSLGALSGSVQVLLGDGSVRGILPYIEQDALFR